MIDQQNHQRGSIIGHGSLSRVTVVREQAPPHKKYALKQVSLFGMSDQQRRSSIQQALILHAIKNQNVVDIYKCHYDPNEDVLSLYLQLCDGDLLHLLQRHKEESIFVKQAVIWRILADVAAGLHHIHSFGFIHRDIKPANILVKGRSFKIADLNISQPQGQVGSGGSPNYLSPQYYRQGREGRKGDIWALGILCHELCYLSNPHSCKQIFELQQELKRSQLDLGSIPDLYSLSLQYLVGSLLATDPEDRPSAAQVVTYCEKCGINRKLKESGQHRINEFLNGFMEEWPSQGSVDILRAYDNYLLKSGQRSLRELNPNLLLCLKSEVRKPKKKIIRLTKRRYESAAEPHS